MVIKNRKSNRLKNYNYDLNGFYFVTICTKDRFVYFGEIKNNKMILNQYGKIVKNFWVKIPKHYENVFIDEFIIMPDHIHGIIKIIDSVGAGQCVGAGHCPAPTGERYGLLSKIINSYKNVVTKKIHQQFHDYGFQWQRSFYDHIICDERALFNIRKYIINNPAMYKGGRNKNV